jgi:outer membrane protein
VGAVTADANVAKDIGGHGEGILGQSNLWLTIPFGPTFSVSTGPGTTWADSRYMHTLYLGRAGIADVHINGLAEWVIHSKYRLGAQAWFGYLRGDAAASPLVVRHEQTTVVGWIAYRFN